MRIPYDRYKTYLDRDDTLIVKARGGKERRILPAKWWINKNTPVGEDAELWERMPHSGRRFLDWDKLIAVERQ